MPSTLTRKSRAEEPGGGPCWQSAQSAQQNEGVRSLALSTAALLLFASPAAARERSGGGTSVSTIVFGVGAAIFGLGYGPALGIGGNAVVGAIGGNAGKSAPYLPLLVPIAGPFITRSLLRGEAERQQSFPLLLLGGAQVLGAGLMIGTVLVGAKSGPSRPSRRGPRRASAADGGGRLHVLAGAPGALTGLTLRLEH